MNPKPDVLALPSATTLRLVVLGSALLVSGLFVGTAVQSALTGRQWSEAVLRCVGSADDLYSTQAAACEAPTFRSTAIWALAAVVLIAAAALALVWVMPGWQQRRLGLVPADHRYHRALAGVAALATESRVRPPALLIGPGAVRQAFCLGRPGRYAIVLPRKQALRTDDLFAAVVRHELAHITHGDVALSWLARSLWFVLAPALLVAPLIEVAEGELGLAADELWRAVVLGFVVVLVQRGVLRAREFDADLRAARNPRTEQVLIGQLAALPPEARTRSGRLLAVHPEGRWRIAVLHSPADAASMGFVDGFTVAYLVAVAWPVAASIANAALLGNPVSGVVETVGALLSGLLLGATLGIGLVRDALARRVVGNGRSPLPRLALGVLVGAALAQLTTLANVGTGFIDPWIALLTPVVMTGVTALVAGLAELWADAAGRTARPAGVWAPTAVLAALLATTALAATQLGALALEYGGWPLLATALTTPGMTVLPALVAAVLGLAVAWTLRCGAPPPAWAIRPGSPPPPWPAQPGPQAPPRSRLAAVLGAGVVAGLAGGAAIVVHRILVGGTSDSAELLQRVDAAVLAAGAVAAATVVASGTLRGPRGLGDSLLAGPVAVIALIAVYFGLQLGLGGTPFALTLYFLGGGLGTGLLLSLPVALTGLRRGGASPTAVVIVAAAVLGAGVAGTAMVERSVLVPGITAVQQRPDVSADDYSILVAPQLRSGRAALSPVIVGLDLSPHSATVVRSEVLPALQTLLGVAEAATSTDPRVTAVNAHALAALHAAIAGFDTIARGIDTQDRALITQGQQQLHRELAEWGQWTTGVDQL